jgi:hypothetical protein
VLGGEWLGESAVERGRVDELGALSRGNGVMVSCFLTPDTETSQYTYPAELKEEIEGLVGRYLVDVENFRTEEKAPPATRDRRDDREAVPGRRAPARDAPWCSTSCTCR